VEQEKAGLSARADKIKRRTRTLAWRPALPQGHLLIYKL